MLGGGDEVFSLGQGGDESRDGELEARGVLLLFADQLVHRLLAVFLRVAGGLLKQRSPLFEVKLISFLRNYVKVGYFLILLRKCKQSRNMCDAKFMMLSIKYCVTCPRCYRLKYLCVYKR